MPALSNPPCQGRLTRQDQGQAVVQKRDIVFFATSKSGLGHLRQTSTIARAIRAQDRARRMRLVTNAPPEGLEAADLAAFDQIEIAEKADMPGLLGPHSTAVLDTMNLTEIEAAGSPRVLVLRETVAGQMSRFVPLAQPWDRVIVANPANHWLPALPRGAARQITPVGWIYRHAVPAVRDQAARPHLLIATGGGGTARTADGLYRQIGAVLSALQARGGGSVEIVQAIGPRAAGFGTIAGVMRTVDPGGALNSLFQSADAVISTAGYNSVLELATTDTPSLLVAIPRSIDDQEARAALWGQHLGMHLTDPDLAADWLAGVLASRSRRAPIQLGQSGETRAADVILELG